MKTLLHESAEFLKCSVNQLTYKMIHPESREKLMKYLMGRRVRTTYEDREGRKNKFRIAGITRDGADTVLTYGKMSRTFNITIAAYFFCRHKIRLQNPYLPCIIEKFGPNTNRYYPLELLEFSNEEEDQCRCADKFEVFHLQREEDDDESSEEQCSFCTYCSEYH